MRSCPSLCLTVAAAFSVVACSQNRAPQEPPAPSRPYPGVKNTPYTLRGHHYKPMSIAEALHYRETGGASFYNAGGGSTATGEHPKSKDFYAAHRTLPLPCVVKITNPDNGKSCTARVLDRGPFHPYRIIDVSPAVARELDFVQAGVRTVDLEVLSVGDGPYRRTPQDKD